MTRHQNLGVLAITLVLATVIAAPWANRGTPSEIILTRWPTTTTTTASTSTSSSTTTTAPPVVELIPNAPAPPHLDGRFRSTAYCLTGRMASGTHTYVGAVAGNRWALGTTLTATPNPWGDPDMEFTVEDRHQPDATQLDFAMPGECERALTWGNRHQVTVHVTGAAL